MRRPSVLGVKQMGFALPRDLIPTWPIPVCVCDIFCTQLGTYVMRRPSVLGVKQMGFALPRDFILPSLSQLSIVILVE